MSHFTKPAHDPKALILRRSQDEMMIVCVVMVAIVAVVGAIGLDRMQTAYEIASRV